MLKFKWGGSDSDLYSLSIDNHYNDKLSIVGWLGFMAYQPL